MGRKEWKLYGVLHKDSPFSLTSSSSVVAQHRLQGIPSLYKKELTQTQRKVLQRAVSDFLRNKSVRTGLIPVSECYESARDEANQLVKDGKENVVLYKVYIPRNRRPRFTRVYFGNVRKLARSCILGPHGDIHEDDYVFLDHIPAEYIDYLHRFN